MCVLCGSFHLIKYYQAKRVLIEATFAKYPVYAFGRHTPNCKLLNGWVVHWISVFVICIVARTKRIKVSLFSHYKYKYPHYAFKIQAQCVTENSSLLFSSCYLELRK